MGIMKEVFELVIRYMKDKFGWETSKADLVTEEWSGMVAAWWDAKVFYKLDNHYSSLDQVHSPEEGMRVFIRTKQGLHTYHFEGGTWQDLQVTPQSVYRK